MADEKEPEAPGECLACRGTGTLTSGLGGTPHDVRCPWCEGTGTRIPGIDAQEHPAESGAPAESAAAAESDTPDAGEAEKSVDAS